MEVRYAGFWSRVYAFIVDALILAVLAAPYSWVGHHSRTLGIIAHILSAAMTIAYFVALTAKYGQTPGKMAAGIEVRTVGLEPITLKHSAWREVVNIVTQIVNAGLTAYGIMALSEMRFQELGWMDRTKEIEAATAGLQKVVLIFTTVWALSELIVLLTNGKRRSLHDFIAGTVVIHKRPEPAPSTTKS